jgi:hypothetical protein
MKYKTGDKVKIKSFDWYIANECGGLVTCDGIIFHERMARLCGKELTIDLVYTNDEGTSLYIMKEPETQWRFTDGMIEGLVEVEPQEKMVSLDKACEYLESALKPVLGYYSATEFADTFRKVMEE